MPPVPKKSLEQKREQEWQFLRYLDRAMNLSNRTKLELETGALNVGWEAWLRHVSDALMIHTLHRLIFPPNIGK